MWKELKKNQLVKYGAVTTVSTISYVLLRKWIAGGICRSHAKLHGRTVVITGANTGIGKETAWDMAMRGARVIMACRDLTRGEAAATEIRSSTGNTNVVVQQLNLASLGSVRQFAREFIATETRLDILINNAGIMLCPKSFTVDGFESQFAVNHLGHFLLTNLLLDMLKASTPSRVVTVSSIAHQGGKIHYDDLNFDKKGYNSVIAYKQSKLANLLFSRELARRTKGTGVTSYSLHPGVIRTELWRHSQSKYPTLSSMLSAPAWLLMKTPREGAQTTIYCAVTEGLEEKSGYYFSRLQCCLKEYGSTSNRPHNRRPRLTTTAQDLHIRLLHLRDCLRPATRRADETVGLHNCNISPQTVRNCLREAHLHARRPHQGLDLTAVRLHNRLQWENAHLR